MIVKLTSDSYSFISKNIITYTQQIYSTMDDVQAHFREQLVMFWWDDKSFNFKDFSRYLPLEKRAGPLPHYGSFISRIFPYYGKHFHAMELDKTIAIGFSNLFLTIFTRYFRTSFSSAHT